REHRRSISFGRHPNRSHRRRAHGRGGRGPLRREGPGWQQGPPHGRRRGGSMSTEGMEHEAVSGLDPWGLRRIEKLLVELEGVGSLKIIPDGHGGIDEVHVLSASELNPKHIVRNIESALLAEFGMQIDHRKISIARTRAPEISPAQALKAQQQLENEAAAE